MAPEIIARKVALKQGLARYFTGRECKYGHTAERHTSSGSCLVCGRLTLKKRYRDNPEHHKARTKKWRKENPDKSRDTLRRYLAKNPEKRKATVLRWRKENPEKVKEINRRGSRVADLRHPERRAESRRKWAADPENKKARAITIAAWRKENPDKSNAIVRNRRARAKGASGTHTAADLAEIFALQGGRCAYCRADLKKVKKHVDHIIALSKGGTNDRSNLQWTCVPCNVRKNARDPVAFARSIGLLL